MLNLLCAEASSSSWIMPVVLIVMVVLMVAMTYFPQKKRKKEAQQMMQSVRVGKKIKTIGGFVGEIVSIDEKNGTMELNVGSKTAPVIVVVDKGAIYTVLNPDIPVQEQKEVKADENDVPTAVTADDAEQDAVVAEKAAEKRAKKDAKRKEKEQKKAQAADDNELIDIANNEVEAEENAAEEDSRFAIREGEVEH